MSETVTQTAQTTTSVEAGKATEVATATTEAAAPATESLVTAATESNVENKTQTTEEPPKNAEAKPIEQKPIELKLPDGSKLDKAILEETLALAKEKGWTQEQAQQILDKQVTAVDKFAQQQEDALITLNNSTWVNEIKADKEFGGVNFDENGVKAAKALKQFFGQEAVDLIKAQNLNHLPWMFKGLVRIANAMADDKIILQGAVGEDSNVPLEQLMYPKMFQKE